jgi:hypothetical protein
VELALEGWDRWLFETKRSVLEAHN